MDYCLVNFRRLVFSYFWPPFLFYTPWKYQKTVGCSVFLGSIRWELWPEIQEMITKLSWYCSVSVTKIRTIVWNLYLRRVNNGKTRRLFEICSKLRTTLKRLQWLDELISHIVRVFPPISSQCSVLIPRENIRKPKLFWCFQGDQKGSLGKNGLNAGWELTQTLLVTNVSKLHGNEG